MVEDDKSLRQSVMDELGFVDPNDPKLLEESRRRVCERLNKRLAPDSYIDPKTLKIHSVH